MMSVLMISRSETRRDSVISAATVVTAKMELTEPAVRVEMDIPLKRAVIVRVQLNQKLQVQCFEHFICHFVPYQSFVASWS